MQTKPAGGSANENKRQRNKYPFCQVIPYWCFRVCPVHPDGKQRDNNHDVYRYDNSDPERQTGVLIMTPKKDFSDEFIEEIKKQGFPIIGIFDHMDASALIDVKNENKISVGLAYGEEFIKPGKTPPYTLKDITEEGLFRLHKEGVRPGDEYWDEVAEAAKDEDEN